MKRLWILVACLTLIAGACSSKSTTTTSSSTAAPTPSAATRTSTPTATLKDFAIALDNSNVTTGSVTFQIKNNGPSDHEFLILGTDVGEASLPMDAAGTQVVESGAGVQLVDKVANIAANETRTLTVALDTGRYVLICNLAGHYKLGMHAAFEVS